MMLRQSAGELRLRHVWIVVCLAGLLATLLLILTRLGRVPPTQDFQDAQLIAAVRRAVRNKIMVNEVEMFVGHEAAINTSRATLEREFLLSAKYTVRSPKAIGNLSSFADAVYWIRPTRSRYAEVVGIAYTSNNKAILFFATLYPP